MYHNILVPMDGTKRSETILPIVEKMALEENANVMLLKIEDPPICLEWDEVMDIEAYQKERNDQKEKDRFYLQGICEEFKGKGIHASCQVVCGDVASSIISVARAEHADLIALTTRGVEKGYQHVDRSVATTLLQNIDRPLLLIRENGENGHPR